MPKKILIIGCGYVGQELARQSISQGLEVAAITRQSSPSLDGVRWYNLDITDPPANSSEWKDLTFLCSSGDWTICYLVSAKDHSEAAYGLAYVTGVRSALRLASNTNHFLFVSSTAVYGQCNGELVDEDSPTAPQSFAGKILLEGEEAALQQSSPAAVVRFSGIYGPGRTRLIRSLQERNTFDRMELESFTNRIHRDDCARLLLHISQYNLTGTFIGSDDEPAKLKIMREWLSTKRSLPPLEIEETASAPLTRLKPQTGEALLRGSKKCNNKKIKETGFSFTFPTFREGYLDLLNSELASMPFGKYSV